MLDEILRIKECVQKDLNKYDYMNRNDSFTRMSKPNINDLDPIQPVKNKNVVAFKDRSRSRSRSKENNRSFKGSSTIDMRTCKREMKKNTSGGKFDQKK